MDSYNKTNVNIAGWITWMGVTVGLVGGFVTHSQLFIDAACIPVGLTAIVFNHDLAMRDFVKYKANYKLFRGAYVVVGIVFIVVSVLTLVNHP
jgi:hypothetical protein